MAIHKVTPTFMDGLEVIWTTGATDTQEYLPVNRMKTGKSKPSPSSEFPSRTLSSIRVKARILSVRAISTSSGRYFVREIRLLLRNWTGLVVTRQTSNENWKTSKQQEYV